jgi:opacity protein-like surface antigen
MKKHLTLLLGTALTLFMLSAPAYAFNSYISGNIGWSASNDLDINNTNGSLLVKLPLQAGTNLQGAIGSKFENFRIEGELGYQRKAMDLAGVNGSSKILSLLANGYYDIYTEGIQPYVTGGVGLGWESLGDFVVGGNAFILSGGVTKLAYQLGFGVVIPIVKNIAIDARYRHFAMGEITEGNLIKYTPSTSSFLLGLRVGI